MSDKLKNITDELHFSSLLDEIGRHPVYKEDSLVTAFIAGQIALIQRMMKETHGMFDGEKLIGIVDMNDLEQLLLEKLREYKATGESAAGDQQSAGPAAVRTDQ